MEGVPDMSIREPVSTHMKCGPMGRKSMVLIGAQVAQDITMPLTTLSPLYLILGCEVAKTG